MSDCDCPPCVARRASPNVSTTPADHTFAEVYKRACEVFPVGNICLTADAWRYDSGRELVRWRLYVESGKNINGDSLADVLEQIERAGMPVPTHAEQLAAVVTP